MNDEDNLEILKTIGQTDYFSNVRVALTQAWQDHQHSRDQTWKALQIEVVLVGSLIVVQYQFQNKYATLSTGILVLISALFGIAVTVHHRRYQRQKFNQISKFERELGLLNLIGDLPEPKVLNWYDIINLSIGNTPLFIIRMYLAIIIFIIIFISATFLN